MYVYIIGNTYDKEAKAVRENPAAWRRRGLGRRERKGRGVRPAGAPGHAEAHATSRLPALLAGLQELRKNSCTSICVFRFTSVSTVFMGSSLPA